MKQNTIDQESAYTVFAKTEVLVPSIDHPKVPYYVYVLKNEKGETIIWKSDDRYDHQTEVNLQTKKITKKYSVGVIGAGTTGAGIVALLLVQGFKTVLFLRDPKKVAYVQSKIQQLISSSYGIEMSNNLLESLQIVHDYKKMSSLKLIIESISENKNQKLAIYSTLEKYVTNKTIIVSNTSSLSLETLSKRLLYPGRFAGFHFFNPVLKMRLVEIMSSSSTEAKTIRHLQKIAQQLGKTPVVIAKHSEGYIVNRILFSLLSEALQLFQQGKAAVKDIDTAIELGLNHPIGPFKLMDLIGLDVCSDIFQQLHLTKQFKNNQVVLSKLIKKGHLGKKSGRGFYTYAKSTKKIN